VLEKSAGKLDALPGAARPLKEGAHVRIHHGSGCFTARVAFSGMPELTAGQRAIAQLRCESPLFAFVGDHFIVRDWAAQSTLAGGTVLDPEAERKNFHQAERQRWLEERHRSLKNTDSLILSEIAKVRASPIATLLLRSLLASTEIASAVRALSERAQIATAGGWAMQIRWWNEIRSQALAAVDAEHRLRPQTPGLPLSDLRGQLKLPQPELFDLLLAELCRSELAQEGTAVKRRTHRPALPEPLRLAGNKLRAILSDKPLEPPSRKELAPDLPRQQALRFLVQSGEAVEIGPDLILLTDSFRQLTDIIRNYLVERGSATVSDLRQAAGVSRRIMVPLLERLDRDGVTLRQADLRVLRKP
jgi:selenocysteine-specific elongation factor